VAFPERIDPEYEIGDVDPVTIGAIIARYGSEVGPMEITGLCRKQ
jgi:hypothetical protein